jgi:hypothetical protein
MEYAVSRGPGHVEDTRGLADSRFRYSDSNSECGREAAIWVCSMHCGGRVRSYIDRISRLDKSAGPEIPSLVMGAPPIIWLSESRQGTTSTFVLLYFWPLRGQLRSQGG